MEDSGQECAASSLVSSAGDATGSAECHGGDETSYPLDVSYCGVCTLPHEFCEYSDSYGKCKQWRKDNLAGGVGGEGESAVSHSGCEDGEESTAVQDSQAQESAASGVTTQCSASPAPKGILKKPKHDDDDDGWGNEKTSRRRVRWEPPNLVTIGTLPRGKKITTVVKGLVSFGVDIKKASRTFAQKFACGVSTGEEQSLILQGDVVDDLIHLLKSKFPQVPGDVIRNVGDMKK